MLNIKEGCVNLYFVISNFWGKWCKFVRKIKCRFSLTSFGNEIVTIGNGLIFISFHFISFNLFKMSHHLDNNILNLKETRKK